MEIIMRKTLRSILNSGITLGLLFSLGVAIDSQARGLGGTWEGKVSQDNPPSTFPMEMTLYGNVGNINYPTLGCGGKLEFVKADGKSFWYSEHLTFGKDKCIDGGMIQLSRLAFGDETNWDWRWKGGGVSVRGAIRGSGVAESK
jgi:hypothetical protein